MVKIWFKIHLSLCRLVSKQMQLQYFQLSHEQDDKLRTLFFISSIVTIYSFALNIASVICFLLA